ncbi:hypothetical protein CPB85DRAFT_1305768 [Mucidula mucida]|nr:hypothetical protein CPB85DRAFT_1305768 [Mucidula mucida]
MDLVKMIIIISSASSSFSLVRKTKAFTAIVDSKFAVLGTVASPEPKARIHGHHETTVPSPFSRASKYVYGGYSKYRVGLKVHGGLSFLNKEISNAQVPGGFVCTFFEDFGCLNGGVNDHDVAVLTGGAWKFFHVQGIAGTQSFNDLTSSFTCSPV